MKVNSLNEAIKRLPQYLYDSLLMQYDQNIVDKIIKGYCAKRYTTLRVNTLKSDVNYILNELKNNQIKCDRVLWYKDALIIKNADENKIKKLSIYEEGMIYLQNLSSMLPPLILNPKENSKILDMASAPGGKSTQIAALSNNLSNIIALEVDQIRFEKLKYNINKQGASSIKPILIDGRKYNVSDKFDYILLDAPCSGTGTIDLNDKATYISFSEKLVSRSASIQKSLLKKGLDLLDNNRVLLYSTCSILKKENEDVIMEVLKEYPNVEIVPISFEGMNLLVTLPCKIKGAMVICPNELYEGFFVCKLRKKR